MVNNPVNNFIAFVLGNLWSQVLSGGVRYFIRSTKTQKYFHEGQWTLDSHLAQAFPDTSKALGAYLRYHLKNVELVLQFRSEPSEIYDLCMPLSVHSPCGNSAQASAAPS
jgi:hypothetical protein